MRVPPTVVGVVVMILVSVAPGCTYPAAQNNEVSTLRQQVESLQQEAGELRETVTRLSYNTASGGGVNLKMMPDPKSGEPTVPLAELFSFDRNHAICRVETNPQAFKMPTYKMGEVVVGPHQFFMSMVATSIEQYKVTTDPNGSRRVMMRGGLDCATEVGQAEVTIGSRTAAEHATYKIEAVDGGAGGGAAGDSFAFTVFFDPKEAPVNYAIFGPEFTFTGELVEGEVTIVDPHQ
ncbi:MAG: hypothetical protein M5U01_06695 [Ardenticatenaceae bacterium]|nr:hypothetical protein [Ardenticatenaceae bacterium]HBY98794.1 hypothetical protein [Chloroflexota bacterium]